MTVITRDHAEFAVVDRLRLLLEEPPHRTYNVTHSYSLFTTILCWVMQHIRIKADQIASKQTNKLAHERDKIARKLCEKLAGSSIDADPWHVPVAPIKRIVQVGGTTVEVPAPQGFKDHTAERFLTNLRDATAHGDARNVEAFNKEELLVGFTFACAEYKDGKNRNKASWTGEITLLEADLRRIGIQLSLLYCEAMQRPPSQPYFGIDAATKIREVAG